MEKLGTLLRLKLQVKGMQILNIWFSFKECMDGFLGENCSYSCPYPTYGKKCKQTCHCDNATCVPTTGCSTGKIFQVILDGTCVVNLFTTEVCMDEKKTQMGCPTQNIYLGALNQDNSYCD